jgi:histidyl-tRNA synthetase
MQTREWAGPPVAIRTKVEPVSGFPEWLPNERLEEQRIIRTIQGVYELYGFVPIETPAVERLDVLTAKGGMQRQIFSLGRPQEDDSNQGLGLHFDLTVPLARYVVQHAPKLSFPFRRYQIQKVWRGERSQKGRFREFYQCDVDIIGRGALDLIHDAEIPCVINATFEALGIPDFEIHVSNRRIFGAVLAAFGIPERQDGGLNDRFISALRAIDKTHRDGVEQTREALAGIGLAAEAIQSVVDLIQCRDLPAAELLLSSIGADQAGLRELKSVMVGAKALGMPGERLVVDFRIARGLDYYTGTTYESYIKGKESWGSICSGGRFDDLASYFTSQKYPGVGISIGRAAAPVGAAGREPADAGLGARDDAGPGALHGGLPGIGQDAARRGHPDGGLSRPPSLARTDRLYRREEHSAGGHRRGRGIFGKPGPRSGPEVEKRGNRYGRGVRSPR